MLGSIRQLITFRLLGAVTFVVAMTVLIAATALREPLAIKSPTARSRNVLALAAAQARQPRALHAQMERVALADPLHAAGFVLLGLERIQQDNAAFDRVKPLMDAAAQRQPSLEAPQAWLAADFARRGDYSRSLTLFDRVLSRSGGYAEPLMPALTMMLQHPDSRAAVVARLRLFPKWRSAVLGPAISRKILDRATTEALLAGPAPQGRAVALDQEREQYLMLLVSRGETAAAHALYRRYVGISTAAPLYDGAFAAARSYKPFGWTLADQAEDYAERVARADTGADLDRGGGWMIRLHASGKRPLILLEQTLALAPGRWTVRLAARDGGLARPDYLALAVRCLGAADALATRSLGGLTADGGTIGLTFTVPAGCVLQRLAIAADGSDQSPAEIEVLGVKVAAS
ncbi:MAG: hypothetical protein Q8R44_05140 [Novosphingobium sp.]|nr:hypothetical protein [Novosphingobium sp.]